ncbi:hypothetical protein CW304_22850 [Bacillus sp. UFRGS-B20]|nr:hypothetical protein CW304_22850 [Bacillus sp. UFRGS-B20]
MANSSPRLRDFDTNICITESSEILRRFTQRGHKYYNEYLKTINTASELLCNVLRKLFRHHQRL